MTLVNAYEMSRLLTMARALRASHSASRNETMIHAKKIHLPICAPEGKIQLQQCQRRNRRTHPEGHEQDVLLRLGIRLGRLGLQDLARPAVRSEQGHESIDVGDVDGDRDDERRPKPGERGAAAASPAVELVYVDEVKLRE